MKTNDIDNYIIWGEIGEKEVTLENINRAINVIRAALDEAIEIRDTLKNVGGLRDTNK